MSYINNPTAGAGGGGVGGPYTVATLPPTPVVGQMAFVTDGAAGQTWAQNIVGGSNYRYMVWWNGAHWTVVGDGGSTTGVVQHPTYYIYGF